MMAVPTTLILVDGDERREIACQLHSVEVEQLRAAAFSLTAPELPGGIGSEWLGKRAEIGARAWYYRMEIKSIAMAMSRTRDPSVSIVIVGDKLDVQDAEVSAAAGA